MTNSERRLNLIEKLEAEIDKLKKELSSLLNEHAAELCPYKIGDIVKVGGYSHYGKQCRIDRIVPDRSFRDQLTWKVIGTVLRKDGSASKIQVDWSESQAEYQQQLEARAK